MNLEIEAYEGELRELRKAVKKKKPKWSYLTPDEILEIHFSNDQNPYDVYNYIRAIEKEIRKKNK